MNKRERLALERQLADRFWGGRDKASKRQRRDVDDIGGDDFVDVASDDLTALVAAGLTTRSDFPPLTEEDWAEIYDDLPELAPKRQRLHQRKISEAVFEPSEKEKQPT